MARGLEKVVVEVVDDNREEIGYCGNLIKLAVYWLTWCSISKSYWCFVGCLGSL